MRTISLCSVLLGAVLLTPTSRAAEPGKLTEAQAIGVMLTANAAEVQIGQMVAARTTNPEVRAYAIRLLDDHLASNREMLTILERNGMRAAESPMRDKMFTDANKEVAKLWTQEPGAAFDKMFLTEAIGDHVEDLKQLDEQLMPSATTAEVKESFTALRGALTEHLQQACQLGQGMGVQSKDCPTMAPGTR